MNNPQALFAALADPTRRSVFEVLTREGPRSASALAEDLPISRQAIAKHLGVLDEAGLVARAQVGREIRYTANPDRLTGMTDWADRVDAQWKKRLELLRESLG